MNDTEKVAKSCGCLPTMDGRVVHDCGRPERVVSCARCGEPARGHAGVDGKRLCHEGASPTCYELETWEMAGRPRSAQLEAEDQRDELLAVNQRLCADLLTVTQHRDELRVALHAERNLVGRLQHPLHRIAAMHTDPRPDGTFNYSRAAIIEIAREALK